MFKSQYIDGEYYDVVFKDIELFKHLNMNDRSVLYTTYFSCIDLTILTGHKTKLLAFIIQDENAPFLIREWALYQLYERGKGDEFDLNCLPFPDDLIDELQGFIWEAGEKGAIHIFYDKRLILSIDSPNPALPTQQQMADEIYVKALVFLLLRRTADQKLRSWAVSALKHVQDKRAISALSHVYCSPHESKHLKDTICGCLCTLANADTSIFQVFAEKLLLHEPISSNDEKLLLCEHLIGLSVTQLEVVKFLQRILEEIGDDAEYVDGDETDSILYKALVAIAKRDQGKHTHAKDALETLKPVLTGGFVPSLDPDEIEEEIEKLLALYEPIFDESSDANCSESDDDLPFARQQALKHIKAIIAALATPTPVAKVELYTQATTLARQDLLQPGRNQTAINRHGVLSPTANKAIQQVAETQKGANCRHNPILRTAIIKARGKVFSSRVKDIGFFKTGDSSGNITNEKHMTDHFETLYNNVRKHFPVFLLAEFKRLQTKYQFIEIDFESKDDYLKWVMYCQIKLSHDDDLIALHHIAYKEKHPRLAISTRNLEVVTDAPRSSTPTTPEGTHSANHRMMAIGEPDIMKTQSPQVLSAYKQVTSMRRKQKKKTKEEEEDYQADNEANLPTQFGRQLQIK